VLGWFKQIAGWLKPVAELKGPFTAAEVKGVAIPLIVTPVEMPFTRGPQYELPAAVLPGGFPA
jgi:hypothetical protein